MTRGEMRNARLTEFRERCETATYFPRGKERSRSVPNSGWEKLETSGYGSRSRAVKLLQFFTPRRIRLARHCVSSAHGMLA